MCLQNLMQYIGIPPRALPQRIDMPLDQFAKLLVAASQNPKVAAAA
jgi:hypothetical protein